MTLDQLKVGQDAILRTIGGEGELRHHLLDQLQRPGRDYAGYQQPYAQPSGAPGRFCLSFWMYLLLCNIMSWCCCGGRGGFFIC